MSGVLEWTTDFELGLAGVDEQHRDLVDLINRLRRCMGHCAGQAELGELLAALEAHTEQHFLLEEQMMAESQFPNFERHRANHEAFVLRLREARRRHLDGALIEFQTLAMLRGWLVEHMLRADCEFGAYLERRRRPRGPMGRLFRRLA